MAKIEDGFNKLQYSRFIGEAQVVVRTSDKTEFLDLVSFVDDFCEKQVKSAPVAVSTQPPQQTTAPSTMKTSVCPIHGVTMYEKTGAYGPYFSHYDKVEGYCNGKGWKKQTYKKY